MLFLLYFVGEYNEKYKVQTNNVELLLCRVISNKLGKQRGVTYCLVLNCRMGVLVGY
jgi:hypothetical protein